MSSLSKVDDSRLYTLDYEHKIPHFVQDDTVFRVTSIDDQK